MLRFAFGLLLLGTAPSLASDALPLADGVYKPGRCGGAKDIIDDIVIADGGKVIAPGAAREFPGGICEVRQVTKSGDTVSGTAQCFEGASASNDMGVYAFSYRVTGKDRFTADGAAFRLCIPYE